jgi:PadR family transcriptional regulator, regulatory protein PadR
MNAEKNVANSHIALLVLSLINEVPLYGYAIIKELEARSEKYFQFKEGSLYPVLHQLEKDALVKTEWRTQQGKPNRRYYTITSKGRKALVQAKGEFEAHTKAMKMVMGCIG